MKHKVIGVACSPRSEQSTRFALEACLGTIDHEFDALETALIDLAGKSIHGCIACGKCAKELACSQDDDFPAFIPLLSDPSVVGLILATPVYLGGMTAQANRVLRTAALCRRQRTARRRPVRPATRGHSRSASSRSSSVVAPVASSWVPAVTGCRWAWTARAPCTS